MVREFTDEKLAELLKYAQSREEMNWFERRWDDITDLYKRVTTVWPMGLSNLFKSDYISGNKEREKKYRAAIVDVEDYGEAQLRTMFRLANDQDEIEAALIRGLYDDGEQLLRELKALTEIITPTGAGVSPLNGNAALESVGNSSETVVVHASQPAISDERLIEHCQQEDSFEYRQAVLNVSDAVCNMDFATAVLIALFNHKDIILDDLLHKPGAPDARTYVYEQIQKGAKGYDSIDVLIQELAAKKLIDPNNKKDLEYVRYALSQRAEGKTLVCANDIRLDSQRYGQLDLMIVPIVDCFLNNNLQAMIKDENMFAAYCEYLGKDPQLIKDLREGKISGYEVSLYQDALYGSLTAIFDKSEYKICPQPYKDIIKGLKEFKKIGMSGKSGEAMEEMLKNGVLSKKEAAEFLEMYCGIKNPGGKHIKALKTLTKHVEVFEKIDKIAGGLQDGIDYISYWFADYSGELELVDQMIEAAKISGDTSYESALERLRDDFSDKFSGTLNRALDMAASEGWKKLQNMCPLLTLTETAIDFVGITTGAKNYCGAAQKIISYSAISGQCVDNYSRAIEAVQAGDASESALLNVRSSFEIMKQVLSDYYDAQIVYARKTLLQVPKEKYMSYLEYEKHVIDHMELGQKFEAMSFEEFQRDVLRCE